MLDCYVIPRGKMKDVTYGESNEGAVLIYTRAILVELKAKKTVD